MELYRNQDSGIIAYKIYEDYILIKFKGEVVYRYDKYCVGEEELEIMKKFAEKEDDLNTYINQNRYIYKCGREV